MDIFACLDRLLPRYIRILGDDKLVQEVPLSSSVAWLNNKFIAVPGTVSMKSITDGSGIAKGLYPMDAASAIAVLTLLDSINGTNNGVKCLDLCCCPGNKLLMMSDIIASTSSNPKDIIIGIDISRSRMNTCKSLLKQVEDYYMSTAGPHEHPRHLLLACDGQLYGKDISSIRGTLTYDSAVVKNELLHFGYHKKRNKSTRKREEIALAATEDAFIQGGLVDTWNEFDYVLCDVQCTHDYSYRHMIFNTERGEETSHQGHVKIITTDNNDELEVLQRQLLQNGFDLLKSGGSLVYSTCSEFERQNEAIVRWVLDHNSNAVLVPLVSATPDARVSNKCNVLRDLDDEGLIAYVNGLSDEELRRTSLEISQEIAGMSHLVAQSGTLPGTLRWSRYTFTSGLFIAKISKK